MDYGRKSLRKPLALQAMRLQALGLPQARTLIPGGKRLEFHFHVSPFPGARNYKCLITMDRDGLLPKAFVLSPDLKELAEGERLPHVYLHDGSSCRLCLYLPGSGEWSSEMFLAETFVAWTIEWLRYFELWLIDGDWRGGGKHPGEEDSSQAK
jgi:hypothetical protein